MVSDEIVDWAMSHVALFSQTLSHSSTPIVLISMTKLQSLEHGDDAGKGHGNRDDAQKTKKPTPLGYQRDRL